MFQIDKPRISKIRGMATIGAIFAVAIFNANKFDIWPFMDR